MSYLHDINIRIISGHFCQTVTYINITFCWIITSKRFVTSEEMLKAGKTSISSCRYAVHRRRGISTGRNMSFPAQEGLPAPDLLQLLHTMLRLLCWNMVHYFVFIRQDYSWGVLQDGEAGSLLGQNGCWHSKKIFLDKSCENFSVANITYQPCDIIEYLQNHPFKALKLLLLVLFVNNV